MNGRKQRRKKIENVKDCMANGLAYKETAEKYHTWHKKWLFTCLLDMGQFIVFEPLFLFLCNCN